jgi:hypothetical protein
MSSGVECFITIIKLHWPKKYLKRFLIGSTGLKGNDDDDDEESDDYRLIKSLLDEGLAPRESVAASRLGATVSLLKRLTADFLSSAVHS